MPVRHPFYQDNGTLRNRLRITDAEALSLAESSYSLLRLLEIRSGEAPSATRSGFDLTHLKAIHRHLFQDIYDWAGQTRAEEMRIEGQPFRAEPLLTKDDGRQSPPFVFSAQVKHHLDETFQRLSEQQFLRGLRRSEFALQAADLFGRINLAHPFLEGNGRSQREFLLQLAVQAGHPLNFNVVSQERMTVASIESRRGEPAPMRRLFHEIVDPARTTLLATAQGFLDRELVAWEDFYLSSATPGREYRGQVALSSRDLVVLREGENVIVAQARDLDRAEGTVTFTASAYPDHTE